MKIPVLVSLLFLPIASMAEPNTLAEDEAAAGFELLFNGSDFTGWKKSGNWIIEEDGSIFRKDRGGSLVYATKKIPDDFELRFEWKVGEGSNSGIYYRPTQYEYQILDNGKHRDGQNPRTSAASLYFCVQPSHDATNPVGEWNTGRIVCKGTVIQHWLNGKKVIGFDYAAPKNAFHVELLTNRGGNLEARGANLSLQDHGDPVWYRNLRLRELGPEDELDRSPVTPEPLAPEVLEAEAKKLEGIIQRRAEAKAKAEAAKKKD